MGYWTKNYIMGEGVICLLSFIFQLLLSLLLSFILVCIIGFVGYSLGFVRKYMKESKKSKISIKDLKEIMTRSRYPLFYEIVKWHVIDIVRGRDFFDLFGIWCFTGYYGEGKTLGAVAYALKVKEKYPNVKIYTNFNLVGQDGKIDKWEDILNLPPWSILIFDEIQGTFASTKFADFPMELLAKLTKCRKKKLAIYASSPVYTRMSIQLRESTEYVIVCKNHFRRSRWFTYDFYHVDQYEKYMEDKDKLKKCRLERKHVVATDDLYSKYDTLEDVQPMDVVPQQQAGTGKSKVDLNTVTKLIDLKMKDFESRLQKKYKLVC